MTREFSDDGQVFEAKLSKRDLKLYERCHTLLMKNMRGEIIHVFKLEAPKVES